MKAPNPKRPAVVAEGSGSSNGGLIVIPTVLFWMISVVCRFRQFGI